MTLHQVQSLISLQPAVKLISICRQWVCFFFFFAMACWQTINKFLWHSHYSFYNCHAVQCICLDTGVKAQNLLLTWVCSYVCNILLYCVVKRQPCDGTIFVQGIIYKMAVNNITKAEKPVNWAALACGTLNIEKIDVGRKGKQETRRNIGR